MPSFEAIDTSAIKLSDEQQRFVDLAIQGYNVLVDACYGSGKTTAIQYLCQELEERGLKVLYLTYNKLLKEDAKAKINIKGVRVTNYHGYAFERLKTNKYPTGGRSDAITNYNHYHPEVDAYSTLIIDEYQDIEESYVPLLEDIKNASTQLQIIAVGDMKQKIYDRTKLNADKFIHQFLSDSERPMVEMTFSKSFRLCPQIAEPIGKAISKDIVSANPDGIAEEMTLKEVIEFLKDQDPGDVLCLGSKTGIVTTILNEIEKRYPEKYNKNTVYATVKDRDVNISPSGSTMIVTTFDSSKGLEKPINIVCDFEPKYWSQRSNYADTNLEILRNIFCVAATRGKERTIFVKRKEKSNFLPLKTLMTAANRDRDFPPMAISEAFDHKFVEDVNAAFALIERERLIPAIEAGTIDINRHDGLIDLSPCIGNYQEAFYFDNYDIDMALRAAAKERSRTLVKDCFDWSTQQKVLLLTALETRQNRYVDQVTLPIISPEEDGILYERLSSQLPKDATVQYETLIQFNMKSNKSPIVLGGFCDVLEQDKIWELKFVSELQQTHFLQLACYMIATSKPEGRLWNTRTNEMWRVTIPNRREFLRAVLKAITKSVYSPDDLANVHLESSKGETAITTDEDRPHIAPIPKRTKREEVRVPDFRRPRRRRKKR